MFKSPLLLIVSFILFTGNLLADASNPFFGIWKPDVTATVEAFKNSPKFDPAEAEKTKKVFEQFAHSMRMKLSDSELEMRMGKSHGQKTAYSVVSVDEKEMNMLLRPKPDKEIACEFVMVDPGKIQIHIDGNNDMATYVWVPAESMEVEDLNVAAVVAEAMDDGSSNSGSKEPSPVRSVEQGINKNLRNIASAAGQYYLENGVVEVTFEDLEEDNYFKKELQPVNGEDYNTLKLKQGEPIKVVDKDGVEHVYEN